MTVLREDVQRLMGDLLMEIGRNLAKQSDEADRSDHTWAR